MTGMPRIKATKVHKETCSGCHQHARRGQNSIRNIQIENIYWFNKYFYKFYLFISEIFSIFAVLLKKLNRVIFLHEGRGFVRNPDLRLSCDRTSSGRAAVRERSEHVFHHFPVGDVYLCEVAVYVDVRYLQLRIHVVQGLIDGVLVYPDSVAGYRGPRVPGGVEVELRHPYVPGNPTEPDVDVLVEVLVVRVPAVESEETRGILVFPHEGHYYFRHPYLDVSLVVAARPYFFPVVADAAVLHHGVPVVHVAGVHPHEAKGHEVAVPGSLRPAFSMI